MPTITPFLWFDDNAEEAAHYYASVFADAEITGLTRTGEAGPGPAGQVMVVSIVIQGQPLSFLNGGPSQQLSEAFSLVVNCSDQDEVDHFWAALSAGGHEHVCGWVKDRFGLSWQIVPTALFTLLGDPDPVKANAVMEAMLTMSKIEIAGLQAAYDAA